MRRIHTCVVFDDLYSLGHFLLGVVVSASRCSGSHLLRLAASAAALLFLAYEVLEDRVTGGLGRAKCDLAEMLAGAAAALPLC